jgi:hypothetical protein
MEPKSVFWEEIEAWRAGLIPNTSAREEMWMWHKSARQSKVESGIVNRGDRTECMSKNSSPPDRARRSWVLPLESGECQTLLKDTYVSTIKMIQQPSLYFLYFLQQEPKTFQIWFAKGSHPRKSGVLPILYGMPTNFCHSSLFLSPAQSQRRLTFPQLPTMQTMLMILLTRNVKLFSLVNVNPYKKIDTYI